MAWLAFLFLGVATANVYTPPRGWNSYDCWTWRINETAFLDNAVLVSQDLLPFGYEYVVIDYLWYQALFEPMQGECAPGNLTIDEYGRLQPDPERFPSSVDGVGFAAIAEKVHSLGLKFGIHVMRGVSAAAVAANSTVLGTPYGAADIALLDQACPWCQQFYAVNLSHPAGQPFLDSLYAQYAEWGVDFIKNDCVFGYQFVMDEIFAVSSAIDNSGTPMVYSLSPGDGTGDTSNAQYVHTVVNMYRVTDDDWDSWDDLFSHFDVLSNYSDMIGVAGKNGLSFPDADMLPLGYISEPGSQMPPYHMTALTQDEQFSQITLWSIARSPLMFGGDMTHMDPFTLSILTNAEVLAVDSYSSNNNQLFNSNNQIAWMAEGTLLSSPTTSCVFVALFNTGASKHNVSFSFSSSPSVEVHAPSSFEVEHAQAAVDAADASSTNAAQQQQQQQRAQKLERAQGEARLSHAVTRQMVAAAAAAAAAAGDISEESNRRQTTEGPPLGDSDGGLSSSSLSLTCQVRDLWAGRFLGTYTSSISLAVNSHGTRLIALYACTTTTPLPPTSSSESPLAPLPVSDVLPPTTAVM